MKIKFHATSSKSFFMFLAAIVPRSVDLGDLELGPLRGPYGTNFMGKSIPVFCSNLFLYPSGSLFSFISMLLFPFFFGE